MKETSSCDSYKPVSIIIPIIPGYRKACCKKKYAGTTYKTKNKNKQTRKIKHPKPNSI